MITRGTGPSAQDEIASAPCTHCAHCALQPAPERSKEPLTAGADLAKGGADGF